MALAGGRGGAAALLSPTLGAGGSSLTTRGLRRGRLPEMGTGPKCQSQRKARLAFSTGLMGLLWLHFLPHTSGCISSLNALQFKGKCSLHCSISQELGEGLFSSSCFFWGSRRSCHQSPPSSAVLQQVACTSRLSCPAGTRGPLPSQELCAYVSLLHSLIHSLTYLYNKPHRELGKQ